LCCLLNSHISLCSLGNMTNLSLFGSNIFSLMFYIKFFVQKRLCGLGKE
jgi:hypothetical protein